ncbi:cytochrome P450 3A1, partial [Nephila pilipes]
MFGTELFTGPLLITFSIGITSLLFLYSYYTRNFDYWKKKGIPSAEAVPFFGSTYSLLWKPWHEIELERYLKYGPLYGHFEGSRPLLSVADLKLVREILVKEFPSFSNRREVISGNVVVDRILFTLKNEDWKRVRSIVSPTFTTGKIRKMVNIVKDCCQTLVKNFQNFTETGKKIDVKEIYGAFTMDVIASSAFSTKLDSHNDPQNRFVRAGKKGFSTNFSFRSALY